MERAIPCLRILDYDEAVAFYVDLLGLEIDFEWRMSLTCRSNWESGEACYTRILRSTRQVGHPVRGAGLQDPGSLRKRHRCHIRCRCRPVDAGPEEPSLAIRQPPQAPDRAAMPV